MTMIFDSARLGNPTKYTGRAFGQNVFGPLDHTAVDPSDPAAVAAYVARVRAHAARNEPVCTLDFTPVFHPTPEEDAWQASTSPLNRMDDEARAMASIYAEMEEDHYPLTPNADPQSWEEFDATSVGGAWGGHPDRLDVEG